MIVLARIGVMGKIIETAGGVLYLQYIDKLVTVFEPVFMISKHSIVVERSSREIPKCL